HFDIATGLSQPDDVAVSTTVVTSHLASQGVGIVGGLLRDAYKYATGEADAEAFAIPDQVKDRKLTEHVESEFKNAADFEIFDGLVAYVYELYTLYDEYKAFQSQNPAVTLSAEHFGFKRFDDPEFNAFMVDLVRACGFKVQNQDDFKQVIKAMGSYLEADKTEKDNIPPDDKAVLDHAYSHFKRSVDPNIGPRAVSSVLGREH